MKNKIEILENSLLTRCKKIVKRLFECKCNNEVAKELLYNNSILLKESLINLKNLLNSKI